MLQYNRIDKLGATDVNKTDGSREWIICYYCYILGMNFRYDQKVCNGCHDIMQKTVNFPLLLLKKMIIELIFSI